MKSMNKYSAYQMPVGGDYAGSGMKAKQSKGQRQLEEDKDANNLDYVNVGTV